MQRYVAPPNGTPTLQRLCIATLAMVSFGLSSVPRPTIAAPCRFAVTATGGYAGGAQARLGGQIDFLLSPAWSWRMAAGPSYAATRIAAQLLAGPVLSLDAFRFVPRLAFLAGADVPEGRASIQSGLEIARYISLHEALTVGAYATWSPGRQAGGLVTISIEFER